MISASLRPLVLAIALVALLAPSRARAEDALPERPATYVVDLAKVISPAVQHELNGYLQELEQKTTAQVIVLTVPSLGDLSVEEFALRTATKWGLGTKEKRNGVLILVAPNDRHARIEVGYGLEGALPDGKVGRIQRTYFIPNFRQGDFSGGIRQATIAVAGAVAAEYGATLTGMPDLRMGRERPDLFVLFAVLIVVIFVIVARVGRRSGSSAVGGSAFGMGGGLPRISRGGSWSSGGSSWDSSGGSSWGSFGGGGGGSFGGGGASSSW